MPDGDTLINTPEFDMSLKESTEGLEYLEEYDTRWCQFEISPIEYWLYVPALDSQPDEDLGVPIRMNKLRPE